MCFHCDPTGFDLINLIRQTQFDEALRETGCRRIFMALTTMGQNDRAEILLLIVRQLVKIQLFSRSKYLVNPEHLKAS